MENKITIVESKFRVESLTVDGEQIWPFLRIRYFFKLRDQHFFGGSPNVRIGFLEKLKTFFFVLLSLPNLFRPADFFCFTTNHEMRNVGSRRLNKVFFQLLDMLGEDNVLRFDQTPLPPTKADFLELNKKIVGTRIFEALSYFGSFFVFPKIIGDTNILMEVEKELGTRVSILRSVKVMTAARFFARILLKVKGPKAIFISYSYSQFHMALIFEAKKLSIPTIEFQHGVVNDQHPAYNRYNPNISTSYYPEKLLIYGENVRERLAKSSFINLSDIVTMGHPLISHYSKLTNENRNNASTIKNDRNPVCLVTLQVINQKEVLQIVDEIAIKNRDIEFQILPRNPNVFVLPSTIQAKNISVVNGNFYELISKADLHMTASSTTALEAPAFGIPNILLDYDGFATKYYGHELGSLSHTHFMKSASEFNDAYERIMKLKAEDIKSSHLPVLNSESHNNLKKFLIENRYL